MWRRAWAILALVIVLVFSFMAGPGHSDIHLVTSDAPATASMHHPGDGDAGVEHHGGGAHCASHCSGHVATTPGSQSAGVRLPRRPEAYAPTDIAALLGADNEPLTPPPTA